MELESYIREQKNWSKKSFGDNTFKTGRSHKGLLEHIQKELKEIDNNPTDLYEWVDLIILGLDGAWRAGFTEEDITLALHRKQCINKLRIWPDNDGSGEKAIEHLKG